MSSEIPGLTQRTSLDICDKTEYKIITASSDILMKCKLGAIELAKVIVRIVTPTS